MLFLFLRGENRTNGTVYSDVLPGLVVREPDLHVMLQGWWCGWLGGTSRKKNIIDFGLFRVKLKQKERLYQILEVMQIYKVLSPFDEFINIKYYTQINMFCKVDKYSFFCWIFRIVKSSVQLFFYCRKLALCTIYHQRSSAVCLCSSFSSWDVMYCQRFGRELASYYNAFVLVNEGRHSR